MEVAFQYPGRNFDKWMDIEFPVEAQRHGRLMGCNPRYQALGSEMKVFEDIEEVYPKSEWVDRIKEKDELDTWMSELITWVCDQNGEGSCVSNVGIKQHEICQARQYGKDKVVRLSPVSLYKPVGRSPGSGSTLVDNIRVMRSRGALPLDTPENKARFKVTFPHNGYYTKYPEGYTEVCNLFKDAEYLDIRTWEGFGTCLLKGYPVMYARSGHCILGCRLFYRSSKLVLGYCNSWGKWGDILNKEFSYGMGYDSESVGRNSSYGAIALRNVYLPESVWSFSTAT